MKRLYIYILLAAVLAVTAVSCKIEEPAFQLDDEQEIIPVTVSLQLDIAPEDYGTPATKAVDDPTPVSSTHIRNLCILQFNGTDMDAPLRGDVHYLRENANPDDEDYLDFGKIKLADSQGQPNTLVFLANTFQQIAGVEKLGDMINLFHRAATEPSVFGHDGDGTGFPTDVTYYQRMNALAVTVVDNGTVVKGTLHRPMARINVEIKNTTGTDNLKIHSAQLRNVSQKDYYVTDYSYIDPSDGVTVQHLIADPFQDVFDPREPLRTDYPARTWEQGGGTAGGTGTANFRWYVPSNMRGIDATNISKEEKNCCQNAYGATYLYIVASYGTTNEPILYRFYLGENLVNDFNLRPNTSYSYRLTFNGKGNISTDKRVEDLGNRKFATDANCYILNPSPEGDRYFSFNVVHRPNVFWGSPNEGDLYDNQTTYPNHYIRSTDHWYARVLWSDQPYTTEQINDMLVTKTGTGGSDYMDDSHRVKIKIPSDIVRGNIVIGVWANDGSDIHLNEDEILWSWHLWITDYQPDRIIGHAPTAGTYCYNVEGGQVHRYSESIALWKAGGKYENGYIMDRYCGAQGNLYVLGQKGGGLFYQFGRKDPFPGTYNCYEYSYDGTRTTRAYNYNIISGIKTVPWSIMNPRRFIANDGNWASESKYNKSHYIWNDPHLDAHTSPEETGKSIFDPCPPGWEVPVSRWIDNLSLGNTSTTNPANNFIVKGHGLLEGCTYYPDGGYLANKNNSNPQAIYFPGMGDWYVNGLIDPAAIVIQSSTAGSESSSIYLLYFWSTGLRWTSNSRMYGFNVRCVRETYN